MVVDEVLVVVVDVPTTWVDGVGVSGTVGCGTEETVVGADDAVGAAVVVVVSSTVVVV